MGRWDEARQAAEHAVSTRRILAAEHPDAFEPELATSLSSLADCWEGLDDLQAALGLDREAIATLAPHFCRHPVPFLAWMSALLSDYLRRCQKADVEPDGQLLAPIVEILNTLQTEGTDDA